MFRNMTNTIYMKSRLLFLIAVISIFFSSCGKRTVFEQRQKFDDLKWNRFKELKFEFAIKDTSQLYNLSLLLRHHSIYPYGELFVTMALYSPSGERRVSDFHLPVKKEDGTFKAEGNCDLWDIDYPLFKSYKFSEAGKYRIELENRMDKLDTEGVMEIGIQVKEAAEDDSK